MVFQCLRNGAKNGQNACHMTYLSHPFVPGLCIRRILKVLHNVHVFLGQELGAEHQADLQEHEEQLHCKRLKLT